MTGSTARHATGRPVDDGGFSTAYVAVGSNLSDRLAHLAHAVGRLDEIAHVTGVSAVYESEPIGYSDQPHYLNMVVRLETGLAPEDLLQGMHRTEAARGRQRSFRNAPRTLDLDLLLYGDRRIDVPGLTVPHPRMTERAFVLVPLLELDPDLTEPGSGRPYMEYLAELNGSAGVPAGPDSLRRVMDGGELLDGEAE